MPIEEEGKDFSIHSSSHGHATDLQAGHGDKEHTQTLINPVDDKYSDQWYTQPELCQQYSIRPHWPSSQTLGLPPSAELL